MRSSRGRRGGSRLRSTFLRGATSTGAFPSATAAFASRSSSFSSSCSICWSSFSERRPRTRYRGQAKNNAQLFTLFGLANLVLARRYLGSAHAQVASAVNAGKVPRERSFSPHVGAKTKPEPANFSHSRRCRSRCRKTDYFSTSLTAYPLLLCSFWR
jgi:hypothetical protein